jgi:hypothetical protein
MYMHVRIEVLNIFTRVCSLILDWFQVSQVDWPREAVVKAAMLDLLLGIVRSPDLSNVYRRTGIVGRRYHAVAHVFGRAQCI